MAANLDDFLSNQLSITIGSGADADTSVASSAVSFGYGGYRLGGGSAPLVLRLDVTAIQADPRAALQATVGLHRSFFEPAVDAARTIASGTGWYSECGHVPLSAPPPPR